MYGKLIDELISGYIEAGDYSVVWDVSDYSNEIYLVRLQTGIKSEARKITLLK
tara:strand:+ start:812 stop:970 length:159 start_codon:yes stop_codon:yes gene_type:complete